MTQPKFPHSNPVVSASLGAGLAFVSEPDDGSALAFLRPRYGFYYA